MNRCEGRVLMSRGRRPVTKRCVLADGHPAEHSLTLPLGTELPWTQQILQRRARGRANVVKGDAEQAKVVEVARSVGAMVYTIGTRRRRSDYQGTMQTPGLPDLRIFLPMPGTRRTYLMLDWETKSGLASLTREQARYRDFCAGASVRYGCGDADTFINWLVEYGWLGDQNRR